MFTADVVVKIEGCDHDHTSQEISFPYLPAVGNNVIIGGDYIEAIVTRVTILLLPGTNPEKAVQAWITLMISSEQYEQFGIANLLENLGEEGWKVSC